ncbi:MAG: MFS transporter, partial [Propionibacterium sp.]|nr:MFS transporter [Propionibacterium sp.]
LLADRIGRRHVFALTLLIYGLATGAAALSIGVGMLIVLRFIVGLGLGAELPVASTLVSEFAPRKIRGRVVVALEAFWALGWIMAALIGFFVVPIGDDGWRWALAVGLVPTAYALVVRFGLPESVRFLESKGRHGEAEAAVQAFEESAGVEGPTEAEIAETNRLADERIAPGAREGVSIWSSRLRARTIALWLVWFGINFSYYGVFIWLPTLLAERFGDLTTSFGYTLIITLAQLPGYAAAAWLIEVWGRRITLATFLAGSAVSAVFFGLSDSPTQLIVAGCFLSFFNLGAWGALYAIGPELYPTNVRGTGTGAAAGFGRIASIVAPLVVPPLLAIGGASGMVVVFSVFAGAFLMAAVAAFTLPEQKGKALAD